MIEKVEKLPSQLETGRLGRMKGLENGKVDSLDRVRKSDISTGVAKSRPRKDPLAAICVEPFAYRMFDGIRITNKIWSIAGATGERGVGTVEHGNRASALKGDDPVYLPVTS